MDHTVQTESLALRRALEPFRTRRQWLASAEGAELWRRAQKLLTQIRRYDVQAPEAGSEASPGSPRRSIQCVHWNVLHGNRYSEVAAAFEAEPLLQKADLISLNEVDVGLVRSGNRDVAAELAAQLGMHGVGASLFLELEGGHRAAASHAQAEQGESLFGLALLSRFPIGQVKRIELPSPENLLFDVERKVGQFVALVAEVLHPDRPFHVVVTHLDVHGAPQLRARQIETILTALPIGSAILMGDLNTTTFKRGNFWHSLKALGSLALSRKQALRKRLLQPYLPVDAAREPLFDVLARAGFVIQPFNSLQPSLDLKVNDLHEIEALPKSLQKFVDPLLRYVERRAEHRLDWIVARGFESAPGASPFSMVQHMRGAVPASDHSPIGCQVQIIQDSPEGSH